MYDIKPKWNIWQLFTGLPTKQSYLFYHIFDKLEVRQSQKVGIQNSTITKSQQSNVWQYQKVDSQKFDNTKTVDSQK